MFLVWWLSPGDESASQQTLSNVWMHFWLSQLGWRGGTCYRHPGGEGQRCRSRSCHVQDSPAPQSSTRPQVQTALSLRNPVLANLSPFPAKAQMFAFDSSQRETLRAACTAALHRYLPASLSRQPETQAVLHPNAPASLAGSLNLL